MFYKETINEVFETCGLENNNPFFYKTSLTRKEIIIDNNNIIIPEYKNTVIVFNENNIKFFSGQKNINDLYLDGNNVFLYFDVLNFDFNIKIKKKKIDTLFVYIKTDKCKNININKIIQNLDNIQVNNLFVISTPNEDTEITIKNNINNNLYIENIYKINFNLINKKLDNFIIIFEENWLRNPSEKINIINLVDCKTNKLILNNVKNDNQIIELLGNINYKELDLTYFSYSEETYLKELVDKNCRFGIADKISITNLTNKKQNGYLEDYNEVDLESNNFKILNLSNIKKLNIYQENSNVVNIDNIDKLKISGYNELFLMMGGENFPFYNIKNINLFNLDIFFHKRFHFLENFNINDIDNLNIGMNFKLLKNMGDFVLGIDLIYKIYKKFSNKVNKLNLKIVENSIKNDKVDNVLLNINNINSISELSDLLSIFYIENLIEIQKNNNEIPLFLINNNKYKNKIPEIFYI